MVSVRCLIPGMDAVSVATPQSGIPALRLLQHHAPNLGIECLDHSGKSVTITLVNLDFSHDNLRILNVSSTRTDVMDKAQLAALGRATTGNAQATAPSGGERNR